MIFFTASVSIFNPSDRRAALLLICQAVLLKEGRISVYYDIFQIGSRVAW